MSNRIQDLETKLARLERACRQAWSQTLVNEIEALIAEIDKLCDE